MKSEEEKPRYRAVCKHCGSDNVGHDANAVWNEDTQAWELGGMFDNEWCSECGADGHSVINMEVLNEQ